MEGFMGGGGGGVRLMDPRFGGMPVKCVGRNPTCHEVKDC